MEVTCPFEVERIIDIDGAFARDIDSKEIAIKERCRAEQKGNAEGVSDGREVENTRCVLAACDLLAAADEGAEAVRILDNHVEIRIARCGLNAEGTVGIGASGESFEDIGDVDDVSQGRGGGKGEKDIERPGKGDHLLDGMLPCEEFGRRVGGKFRWAQERSFGPVVFRHGGDFGAIRGNDDAFDAGGGESGENGVCDERFVAEELEVFFRNPLGAAACENEGECAMRG